MYLLKVNHKPLKHFTSNAQGHIFKSGEFRGLHPLIQQFLYVPLPLLQYNSANNDKVIITALQIKIPFLPGGWLQMRIQVYKVRCSSSPWCGSCQKSQGPLKQLDSTSKITIYSLRINRSVVKTYVFADNMSPSSNANYYLTTPWL